MSKDKNYVFLVDGDTDYPYAFVGTPEEFQLAFNGDFKTVKNLGKAWVYDNNANQEKLEKCNKIITRISKEYVDKEYKPDINRIYKSILRNETIVIYETEEFKLFRRVVKCSTCGGSIVSVYKLNNDEQYDHYTNKMVDVLTCDCFLEDKNVNKKDVSFFGEEYRILSKYDGYTIVRSNAIPCPKCKKPSIFNINKIKDNDDGSIENAFIVSDEEVVTCDCYENYTKSYVIGKDNSKKPIHNILASDESGDIIYSNIKCEICGTEGIKVISTLTDQKELFFLCECNVKACDYDNDANQEKLEKCNTNKTVSFCECE